ncbi:MAG TPA: glutamate cyclase domain-containing protein [Nitrososphaerales archaeon]|nr:glutamate cyclase domain-containing protein [Nitrososphaerales archaeon]
MAEVMTEYIDRLCTIEIKPGGGPIPRGVTRQLYDAARKKQGKPLSYLAAKTFIDTLKKGGSFFIVTGAGGPPILPVGEVDGLLGAASIARALDLAFGAKPVIVGEERIRAPIQASLAAAGVALVGQDIFDDKPHSAILEPVPIDDAGSKKKCKELLDRYHPKAMIAIERLAPNRKGIIHGATGLSYHDVHAKTQYLFEAAPDRKIKTIGIGDMGNETGFGMIIDDVLKIAPFGAKCQCPCGMGMATVTPTDVLVSAAISNWGAYGISAALAALLKRPELLQDPNTQRRMLEACVMAGAVDGLHASMILSDDGVPEPSHQSLVQLLHAIVDVGLSNPATPGH